MEWLLLAVAGIGAASFLCLAWKFVRSLLRESLENEAVVITGCDSGLGFAIVQRLVLERAVVFATCLTPAGLQKCKALGSCVIPCHVDITSDEDVARLMATVETELKNRRIKLRGLVNNAGLGNYGFAEALDLKRFETLLQVNCLGTVRVTKAFLPLLRARGPGARLITMGSLSDRLPAGFGSAYVPTKAYVCWFTESVAAEVRRFGVRTAVIEPGFIATELLDAAQAGGALASEGMCESVRAAYGDFAPMMAELRKAVMICERLNGGKRSGSDWVADSTVDALSSLWPRSRYLVGYETKLLMWLPRIPGWTRILGMIFEKQHRSVHQPKQHPP